MRCPVCEDETLVISSREGIEIDHCPRCRGVWLDRGELDKIIDRTLPAVSPSGAGRAQEPPREFREERRYDDRDRSDDRDRYRDDRYTKKKKKRNFLEDLFEFD